MKLHYSQTKGNSKRQDYRFQYLMKLHYSQTDLGSMSVECLFQYLMKLHYSQTPTETRRRGLLVSVPYEITLLSNLFCAFR